MKIITVIYVYPDKDSGISDCVVNTFANIDEHDKSGSEMAEEIFKETIENIREHPFDDIEINDAVESRYFNYKSARGQYSVFLIHSDIENLYHGY